MLGRRGVRCGEVGGQRKKRKGGWKGWMLGFKFYYCQKYMVTIIKYKKGHIGSPSILLLGMSLPQ